MEKSQKDGRVNDSSPAAGSPLIASMDEYISDLEKGNHISWDGDDFYGLLIHLKEVRSKMANGAIEPHPKGGELR